MATDCAFTSHYAQDGQATREEHPLSDHLNGAQVTPLLRQDLFAPDPESRSSVRI